MAHNEQIPGMPPFIGFIASGLIMIISHLAPEIALSNQWHIPPVVMEISQMVAWWCVGGTFLITALNYLGLKWNPFKKRK